MPPGGGPLGFCIVGGSIAVCDCRVRLMREWKGNSGVLWQSKSSEWWW